jgi:agmatine deiminase
MAKRTPKRTTQPRKTLKTPRELGYTFPAEWQKQSGTWMSWPRPEGISFPSRYRHIGVQLCSIVREIAVRQRVHINVPNENWEEIVTEELKSNGVAMKRVQFHHIKTNESWCRDHGPAFVVRLMPARYRATPEKLARMQAERIPRETGIVDWTFNAWGGKYPPYDDDDRVPGHVAAALKIETVFKPGIVMEGGAVDFNGAGTVLTTTDCLLNKNRNPKLKKPAIEQYLKDFYGQTNVCWLTGGIAGDDTDGHIDDLARFISPTKIAFGIESNRDDENYTVLKDVRRQLDELRDQDGRPFEIVELPMPRPVVIEDQRCPATYMNFLFVNGAILVPIFNDRKNDSRALSILREHLPKHDVVGVRCDELIWGLGAIHCLTQQVPAGL